MSFTHPLMTRCLPKRSAVGRVVFFLLPLVTLSIAALPALAVNWQQPTAEELSMTSVPDAPGAPAIFLFREEIGDDKLHFHSVYVRMKILTEEGKKYADVDMPLYEKGYNSISDIAGRTIHSDGTVVPYTGKALDKMEYKTKDFQLNTRVFALPDVQVGSILEYRYVLRYDDNLVYSPTWYVQQEIPVRSVHFRFVPTTHDLNTGHGDLVAGQCAYSPQLPAGAAVQYLPASNTYELRMTNIPALPTEELTPPIESLSYRVQFYYTDIRKVEEYWSEEGKYWSRDVDKFASPTSKLSDVVHQIVLPADTEQQKAAKIYDAVMQLENTSFTREHSAEENKAEGIKIKKAEDIWGQKRGNDDEITLLFIAMVRAAGLKAYAMRVANRDKTIFRMSYLSMNQLNDDIAIVMIDGNEQYLDPGQRYCPFGQMHWKHTLTGGLRETDHGAELAEAPPIGYKQSAISRSAELTLEPGGHVSGYLRIVMSGEEALKWRQLALTSDAEEVKKKFDDELQVNVPPGVEVKTNHFLGLTDWKTVLMAQVDVSGSLGTATSKRVFLPSTFFEAGTKPLFSHEKRELPVDLQFPYQVSDKVDLKLPPDFVAESLPKDLQLSLPNRAIYGVKYKVNNGTYSESRALLIANSYFDAKEYPELRDFYHKMNAQDQQQIILKTAATGSAAGAAQ